MRTCSDAVSWVDTKTVEGVEMCRTVEGVNGWLCLHCAISVSQIVVHPQTKASQGCGGGGVMILYRILVLWCARGPGIDNNG
jgi:hypothetical protein